MLRRSKLRQRSPRHDRPRMDTSMLGIPKPGDVARAMKIEAAENAPREASAPLRRIALNRDAGVCTMCGVDCEALQQEWEQAFRRDSSLHECNICGFVGASSPCSECGSRSTTRATVNRWKFRRNLIELGFDAKFAEEYRGETLWQADHVQAVVDGGAGRGADNIRTLCLRCHGAVTGDLAQRRANRRKWGTQS